MARKKRKRLYKSNSNKVLAGVIGGLGDYADIDPTVLRLIWLLIVIITGFIPGLLVYLIAILIVPKKINESNTL